MDAHSPASLVLLNIPVGRGPPAALGEDAVLPGGGRIPGCALGKSLISVPNALLAPLPAPGSLSDNKGASSPRAFSLKCGVDRDHGSKVLLS